MRWPELHQRCLAAALALTLPGATGCRERERWPRSDRVRAENHSRTPECQSHDFCVEQAGECPSTLPTGRDDPHDARFDADRTSQRRGRFPYDAGPTQRCCYSWSEGCRGRPIAGDDGALLAPAIRSREWRLSIDAVQGMCARARRHWLEAAGHEHASIAAFARASLELLALGAPPDLIAAHHRAALDEIRHARIAYALASTEGEALGPGPLRVPALFGSRGPFAIDIFRAGCVSETIAAAVARECADAASPSLRGLLGAIADDEMRHAELAWRTLAWLIAGARDEPWLAALSEEIARAGSFDAAANQHATPACDPQLAAFGVIDGAAARAIEASAAREIVSPCARMLLEAYGHAPAADERDDAGGDRRTLCDQRLARGMDA